MGKIRVATIFFVWLALFGFTIPTQSSAQQAQAPTFSPTGGSYSSAQSVTMSDATTGATIYYTTDGSTPTTSSAVYSAPISLSTSQTLSAIAVASGYTNSAVQSATYSFGAASAPTFIQQCNGYTDWGDSLSCTLTGVRAGDALMIGVYGPASLDSVTSSVGTPTAVISDGISSNAYVLANAASGTTTITVNLSDNERIALSVAEYSNVASSPVDTAALGAAFGYSNYIGTYDFQTSADGDLLWSFCSSYWGSVIPPGLAPITWNGITSPVGPQNGDDTVLVEDGIAGPAGTYYGRCEGTGTEYLLTVALLAQTTTARAATPTFSPAAGAYVANQTVTISTATPSATIYYTTDGSIPTTSSIVYTGPITVGVSETVKAIAVASGSPESVIGSALYIIGSYPAYVQQCRTITWGTSLSCTLSGVKAGDALMIGINTGTQPTSVVSSAGTPASVISNGIDSYAYVLPNSAAGTNTITVNLPANDTIRLYVAEYTNVAASPLDASAAGSCTSDCWNVSSTSFNTTNGSDMLWALCYGASWSTVTPGTLPITWQELAGPESPVVYLILEQGLAGPAGTYYGQCNGEGATSIITVALKSIAASAAAPTFSPAAGQYASPQAVTISTTTPSATIYYTTDGTTPTTSSHVYTGPITISGYETVQAIATANDNTLSSVASATYNIGFLPAYVQQCNSYQSATSSLSCTLSGVTAGDALLISFYGPTTLSSVTSSSGTPVSVVADGESSNAYLLPNVTAGTITVTGGASYSQSMWLSVLEYTNVAASPLDGVAVADCGSGCSIANTQPFNTSASKDVLWSLCSNPDGSELGPGIAPMSWTALPTASGPQDSLLMENGLTTAAGTYYGECSNADNIITVALKNGGQNIAATPSFNPAGGSYNNIQTVAINSATPLSTIYYTIDGSTPTTSSPMYTGPITVSSSETIQAIATASGYTQSAVGSAAYTINPPISVSLSPANTSLSSNQTQQFTATVSNTSNTAVNWTISPPGIGTISSSGLYTAPASSIQQTVTVTATSQADTTKSASATIDLLPSCTLNGYNYARSIVIDHTKVPNTDQVNFPVLFSTTDPALKSTSNGGHVANASGYDIIFSTDPNGTTKLDHELEEYNPATGQVIAWIRIPTLSHSTDTVLYMFYGDSSVTTPQQNPAGVWGSNFVGVWHFPNGTTLSATDSSASGNAGTPGTGVAATAGEIDGGASLNGTSSGYISLPGSSTAWNFASDLTVSAWIKTTDNGKGLFEIQNNTPLVYLEVGPTTAGGTANKAVAYFRTNNGTVLVANGTISVNDGKWHKIEAVRSTGNSVAIYIDGVLDKATTYGDSGAINASGGGASIGGLGSGYDLNGSIDEVRISNVARSADWIATEYNNEAAPSTFYALSAETNTIVTPVNAQLYQSQSQQFSATILGLGTCSSTVTWSMPSGSPGTLSTGGLYSAPSNVASEQAVIITATSVADSGKTGASTITLLPALSNPTLVLGAAAAPPYVTGASQQFTAALINRDGSPLSGASVTFTVTGANNQTENATTNSSGMATFTYTGSSSGTDTIQATASLDGSNFASNVLSAIWLVPVQSISTTTIDGMFFLSDGSGTFDTPTTATPAFTQTFPVINFNPPNATGIFSVPGTTMPWNQSLPANVSYPFANGPGGAANGTPSVIVATNLVAGEILQLSATGECSANPNTGWPLVGPNGGSYRTLSFPTDPTMGTFPLSYVSGSTSSGPIQIMGLMGAFTDSSGNIVQIVVVGTGATLTVPTGATQLQLGVNDILYGDNTGSFTVSVLSTLPGSLITMGTRPFTDVTLDQTGNPTGTIPAQGNGYQAGVGPMENFQAVFRGAFDVTSAGNVTFTFFNDDGFIFGVGNGAERVSGPTFDTPITTPFGQYPAMGADNQSTAPTGNQIVVYFPGPGTYPYEVDYTQCCDSQLVLTMDQGASGRNQVAPSGSLTLSPSIVNPLPQGGQQTFNVLAKDASGNPLSNLNVSLLIAGADNLQLSGTTDSTGNATIVYTDVNPGNGTVQAVASIGGMVAYSNLVDVQWTLSPATTTGTNSGGGNLSISILAPNTVTLPSTLQLSGTVSDSGLPQGGVITTTWSEVSGPGTVTFGNASQIATTASFSTPGNYVLQLAATDPDASGTAQLSITVNPEPGVTQGWIGTPADGTIVTGIVPIKVASSETLTSGVLSYYPANNPSNVTVLNSNTTGTGQIGTLDATQLQNGQYWIALQATDSNGNSSYNLALVTVAGNYKPGRITSTVTDLVVPADGLAIKIQRTYDSLKAGTSSDFGYGWSLGTNVDLSVGSRGDVTLTIGGQRRTFYLTPQYSGFLPYFLPEFTPEPGAHGTLFDTGASCPNFFDYIVPDGNLWACVGGGLYTPQGYVYTDTSGTSYTITAAGAPQSFVLQSIVDKNGNTLTITADGIKSSSGPSVAFLYDGNGRIKQITDPQGNPYFYGYDSSGNLESVTYPNVTQSQTCSGAIAPNTTTYSYYPNHLYEDGKDNNCNELPTTVYYGSTATDPNGLPLNGRLASVTDALSETTSYAYNLATNTTTITYPADSNNQVGTATMVYDSMGDLLNSTDPLGHITVNTYDTNQNLLTTTDPLNYITCYTYDANGNQTSVSYPVPNTNNTCSAIIRSTVYNQFSEPTQTTDENGNTRTFNYDVNFNPSTVTDSLGTLASFSFADDGTMRLGAVGYDLNVTPSKASVFTYDANGDMTSRTDALGRTTSYTYNSLGQKVTMVEPVPAGSSASAATTTYLYDAFGDLTQTTAPLNRVTGSQYDGNGNKISDTDARSNTTTYGYDALNRLILTGYPNNTSSSKTYDFRGNVVTETDQQRHVTQHVYDLAGRETSVIQAQGTPDATTTSYTYDNDGRKTSETDALNHTTNYSYDAAGDLTGVSTANGPVSCPTSSPNTTCYAYDNARNRISMTDGNGYTTNYQYDARKRLTVTTYPDSNHTTKTNAYDGPGNLTSVTDQNNNQVQYTYDAANQLVQVDQTISSSATATTVYGYDADGNAITLEDADTHTTMQSFDLLNELTGKTLPGPALTETRQYDNNGNLQSVTHFDGTTTTYTYDSLNRLLSRTTPGEPTVSFTYSATGKRNQMIDASGTTTYKYDNMDRLSSKQTPEGTLSYAYFADGLVKSITSSNANGASVNYTYTPLNQLYQVVDGRLGTTTYAYDPASNVYTVAYPNAVTATYGYDPLNRVTSLRYSSQTGSYNYLEDNTGKKTQVTEPSGRLVVWSYDNANRLTGEGISGAPSGKDVTVAYGLDAVGNRTAVSSGIPGLAPVAGNNPNADDELNVETYNPNGNVVIGANSKTFTYDSQNQLVSSGGSVQITYDGDGNRVTKTVNGVTTYYLVDDLNPTGLPQVMDELVGGAVTRTYTYGLQRIAQDQVISNAWTPSYFGYDGTGSVSNLTNSAGQITDSYEYDAFGNQLTTNQPTPNNYLYRGEQYDPDLGLYYLRARYYNPLTGRFMSRDPREGCGCNSIPDAAKNKYIYASSDPVNRVDPSGRADIAEEEEVTGEVDLQQVGRPTIPKGAVWGGIGLTGVGLEIACMAYTEGIGVGVIGQNIGGLQDPKLLPKICSAISSKMPYIPRPGAVPSPIGYPTLDTLTAPGGPPWNCGDLGPDGLPDECWAPCPNGRTQKLHYDPGTTNNKGVHWDYTDCDGKTWYIWPDSTMTPAI